MKETIKESIKISLLKKENKILSDALMNSQKKIIKYEKAINEIASRIAYYEIGHYCQSRSSLDGIKDIINNLRKNIK